MSLHGAFLRAVNVAGHAIVKMSDVRDAFEAAGCRDVRTCIQSGNVIFRTPGRSPAAAVGRARAGLSRLFGEEPGRFLRTARELEAILKRAPFGRSRGRPDPKLYVTFPSRMTSRRPAFPLQSPKEALEAVAMSRLEEFVESRRKKNGGNGPAGRSAPSRRMAGNRAPRPRV